MLPRSLVEQLRCPYCGSRFDVDVQIPSGQDAIRHGILRCACFHYPIIEGIAVLRQNGADVAGWLAPAIGYLKRAEPDRALNVVLHAARRNRPQGALRLLKRLHVPLAGRLLDLEDARVAAADPPAMTGFEQALGYLRTPSYAHYLFHRYANPSFLAAIPMALLLAKQQSGQMGPASSAAGARPWAPQRLASTGPLGGAASAATMAVGRVLDLGCGAGHASFLISQTAPATQVISCDGDFVNLYLARQYVIPGGVCLCLDAEAPLPFPDDFFDADFCLDVFHYLRCKVAALRELRRVVRAGGLWLFSHLHNALAENFAAGFPLAAREYRRCFDFIQARLFAESVILDQFMREQSLDLAVAASDAQLDRAQAFSLVGGRQDLWCKHEDLAWRLPGVRSCLGINPIYSLQERPDALRLTMTWPDQSLERECESAKRYLPPACELDRAFLDRLSKGAVREDDEPLIRELLKSGVLVPLPPGYRCRPPHGVDKGFERVAGGSG